MIKVRAKVKKFDHQQIVNQALLGETKNQLVSGVIMCFNCGQIPTTEECLCYPELNTTRT